MSPRHPGHGELMDLHFGELPTAEREAVERHVAGCAACHATLDELTWLDTALSETPEERPPSDGLARVLVAVDRAPQAPVRAASWTAAVAGSLAGVAGSAGVIWALAGRLLGSSLLAGMPLPQGLGAAPGFGIATLIFFGIGSLATLAIAPVLLMESRTSPAALSQR